ncbi:unnamed protein product [Oikopleura dioica]|uniref:Uncharacterized protein n=1 Tax=Oikopleura dioica TaxID=34765 RepID=E4X8E6_OIKDI|nr:unnamed protein product [Oikopleura dioica]
MNLAQGKAFWTNELADKEVARVIWALNTNATIQAKELIGLLGKVIESLKRLSKSMTSLGIEDLLENNNVGVMYRVVCSNQWIKAIKNDTNPYDIDMWLKLIPARTMDLEFLTNTSIYAGALNRSEGKKFETKIMIPSAMQDLNFLDDGMTLNNDGYDPELFVDEIIQSTNEMQRQRWTSRYFGTQDSREALEQIFLPQPIDKVGLRDLVPMFQRALSGCITEEESFCILFGPFDPLPSRTQLLLFNNSELLPKISDLPEHFKCKEFPLAADDEGCMEKIMYSRFINPCSTHPQAVGQLSTSQRTLGLAAATYEWLCEWFNDILTTKTARLGGIRNVLSAMEGTGAQNLGRNISIAAEMGWAAQHQMTNFNATAKLKIDTLSKVILADQGNPNGKYSVILGNSMLKTIEYSWINIVAVVMNLSRDERGILESALKKQTKDKDAETELRKMFAGASWGLGHTNVGQPTLNPAVFDTSAENMDLEVAKLIKEAIIEITGGLNYGRRSPRNMSKERVEPLDNSPRRGRNGDRGMNQIRVAEEECFDINRPRRGNERNYRSYSRGRRGSRRGRSSGRRPRSAGGAYHFHRMNTRMQPERNNIGNNANSWWTATAAPSNRRNTRHFSGQDFIPRMTGLSPPALFSVRARTSPPLSFTSGPRIGQNVRRNIFPSQDPPALTEIPHGAALGQGRLPGEEIHADRRNGSGSERIPEEGNMHAEVTNEPEAHITDANYDDEPLDNVIRSRATKRKATDE